MFDWSSTLISPSVSSGFAVIDCRVEIEEIEGLRH